MSEYYNKLQETLDYIEDNIKEEITLEALANLCHYSEHHYHRVFQSVVGIPVMDYIKKRKLVMIASQLIDSDKNILDIALDYGFNSHETFSRAFKRVFDLTPNEYRKLGNHAIPKDFWKVSFKNSNIQKRYMAALESLCDRLKADVNVLAVILSGSLSYDQVWEKSDIDMDIIINDNTKIKSQICLIEEDIYVNVNVSTRSEFKNLLGKTTRGSGLHSYFSLGTLIYCKDESIREMFENIKQENEIGEKDKSLEILRNFFYTLNPLKKAEKYLKVKSDSRYSYVWIIDALRSLSAIEVLLNNHIPSREVILQALKYKNPLIETLYIDLMDDKKNSINISKAIDSIKEYLRERREIICKPILDYFNDINEMKPLSVIVTDFNKSLHPVLICEVCEWLCEEGILLKDNEETYLTTKSSKKVLEPAYMIANIAMDIIL